MGEDEPERHDGGDHRDEVGERPDARVDARGAFAVGRHSLALLGRLGGDDLVESIELDAAHVQEVLLHPLHPRVADAVDCFAETQLEPLHPDHHLDAEEPGAKAPERVGPNKGAEHDERGEDRRDDVDDWSIQ